MTPVELARQLRADNFFLPSNLAVELAEALYQLGGAGHRANVIDWVARHRGEPLTADFASSLIEAFSQAIGEPAAGQEPIMHLPMGPDSHRWSLTPAGYGALRGLLLPKYDAPPSLYARNRPFAQAS
jgi:hypothetical protein